MRFCNLEFAKSKFFFNLCGLKNLNRYGKLLPYSQIFG
jgi:hypothetical protein